MPPVSVLTALKFTHIACVVLSYSLFLLRGIWMLRDSALLRQRWIRITPHMVDSLLLLSAIVLAWQLGISPVSTPWLGTKIIALLLYIVLGSIALKRGKTKRIRLGAWLMGQIIFAYMVSVAVTHDTTPWE